MEFKPPGDLSRLCIHTITTKPLDLETAVVKYASLGIRGITVWRDAYESMGPQKAGKIIRESGLTPVSICRGGFFPSADRERRNLAIEDNLKILQEASELEVPMIVVVCGAEPRQSLQASREQIKAGLEAVLPAAERSGIKLALEPLHPVYADTRSAINTMQQANDMAGYFNSPWLGVAVDVYHVWWDEDLEREIERCGKNNNLFAFHVCDWKVPTGDILLDRGLMGEGCIDIRGIRRMVENAGFKGFNEVEIFSETWWRSDQDEFIEKIKAAYMTHV